MSTINWTLLEWRISSLFGDNMYLHLETLSKPTFKSSKEWQLVAKFFRPISCSRRRDQPSLIRPWLPPTELTPNCRTRASPPCRSCPLRTLIRRKTDLQQPPTGVRLIFSTKKKEVSVPKLPNCDSNLVVETPELIPRVSDHGQKLQRQRLFEYRCRVTFLGVPNFNILYDFQD